MDFKYCIGVKENEREYDYSITINGEDSTIGSSDKYVLEKMDLSDMSMSEKLYRTIALYDNQNIKYHPNDAFYMYNKLGLYQFWLHGEYGENVFSLPEIDAYVIASIDNRSYPYIKL